MGRTRRLRYRHLRRTVIAVLAALALVLVGGLLLLRVANTEFARRAVVRAVERRAVAAGVELTVDELRWCLLPLSVDLDGVRVTVPGFRADIEHLRLGLARVRVAARTVELDTVVADGVRVQRVPGGPPRPVRRDPWLHLKVERLNLRRVTFEGADLPGRLEVKLEGMDAAWASDQGIPRGFVRAGRAQLLAPGLQPIDVQAQARFELSHGVEIPSWWVRGSGADLRGWGRVGESGAVRLEAAGSVDLADLDRVVRAGGILSGRLRLVAGLDTDDPDLLRVDVSADEVEAAGFETRELRGRLVLGREQLDATLDGCVIHGGHLRGGYTLARLQSPYPHRVQLRGDALVLEQLLADLGVPPTGLSATVDVEAELGWDGRAIWNGHGYAVAALGPADGSLPVSGEVDVRLDGDGLLHFAAEDLGVGASTVQWQGPLTVGSWRPAWSMRLRPAKLAELIPLANDLVGSRVLPEEVHGDGELQIDLAGPWDNLRVTARLEASPLVWEPLRFDHVAAEAVVSGTGVQLGPVRYRVGGGDGEVEGRIGREPGEDQLDLSFRGQGLPLQIFASWAGVDASCTGQVSFVGGLRGALSSPRGSWAVGLADTRIAGLALGDGSATVALEDGAFTAGGIDFSSGLDGSVRWSVTDSVVTGDLRWPSLPTDGLPVAMQRLLGGPPSVEARFHWPLDGIPTGRVVVVGDTSEVRVEADASAVSVDAALAEAVTLTANLDRREDGGMQGAGQLRLGSAGELVASLSPEAGIPLVGQGRAEFDVEWPPGQWPRVSGRVGSLELELDGRPVRLLQPAAFSLSDDGLSVDGLLFGLLDEEVFARWELAADGTLRGNVAGTLDALLLRFLLPEWEPAGRATGVVEVLGTLDQPRLEGVAEVSQVSFRIPETRSVISSVRGTLLLSSDEVALEGVDFRFMNGSGRCTGSIRRRDEVLDLSLAGTVADLQYPLLPGLVPHLKGQWRLEGPVDDLELSGDVEVVRAALRGKADLATLIIDWFGGPEGPPGNRGLRLDLRVEADRTLQARSPFLRVVGSASIHVTGTSGQPGMVGTVEFQEGGEFDFQGVRYELDRGSISFSDPLRLEPYVNLEARAWVQDFQITVRLTGTPDHLVPVLSSDPPLPEGEIISLLSLGYRDDSFGGGAVGVGFASTLLTRQLNDELERRAKVLLPVDRIRVDPFTESSTGNPTARITVVKQVSPMWIVMLQSDLSTTRRDVVVSRWFLSPGLFVEASRDLDGTVALDVKVRRRY